MEGSHACFFLQKIFFLILIIDAALKNARRFILSIVTQKYQLTSLQGVDYDVDNVDIEEPAK